MLTNKSGISLIFERLKTAKKKENNIPSMHH